MSVDEVGSWRNCLAVLVCAVVGAVLGGAAMSVGLDYLTIVFAPQARQGQYGLHFLITVPVGVVVGDCWAASRATAFRSASGGACCWARWRSHSQLSSRGACGCGARLPGNLRVVGSKAVRHYGPPREVRSGHKPGNAQLPSTGVDLRDPRGVLADLGRCCGVYCRARDWRGAISRRSRAQDRGESRGRDRGSTDCRLVRMLVSW